MLDLLVVPDYLPEQFSAWYLLNTHLQQHSGLNIRLHMPDSFAAVAERQAASPAAMVYVNPFAAGDYVRRQAYRPLVRPFGHRDEVVLLCAHDRPWHGVEDLPAGARLALSPYEDANLIAQRLLEPAGAVAQSMTLQYKSGYLAVATAVVRGQAEVGVVAADLYARFTPLTRSRLKALLHSRLGELYHVWLCHPDHQAAATTLAPLLAKLNTTETGARLCHALGLPHGFEILDEEDLAFMLDVVDTLR